MEETTWNKDYSVGDAIIDAQHQQLIATMNQVAEMLQGEAPSIAETARIFGALAIYVMDHFGYEEQRMAECAYPADDLARHKAIHVELTRQIREFQRRVNDGDNSALRDLLPFLQGTWLTSHICETDRRYAPYLKGNPKA